MNEQEQTLILQKLQAEVDKNRSAMKKVKSNKILYHYYFHVVSAIEGEILLIKKNKIK